MTYSSRRTSDWLKALGLLLVAVYLLFIYAEGQWRATFILLNNW